MEPEELIISVGSYPCVFEVGNAFYDYTPFKAAVASPVAVQIDITNLQTPV